MSAQAAAGNGLGDRGLGGLGHDRLRRGVRTLEDELAVDRLDPDGVARNRVGDLDFSTLREESDAVPFF